MAHDARVVEASGNAALLFLEYLTEEINRGELNLPSFPDNIIKIRQALADEGCGPERLAKLISTDQGLAARLLQMSNSALISRGVRAVTDLRTAILRLGFNMVRNAAMSAAIHQMFQSKKAAAMRREVRAICREGADVASLAFIIARVTERFNADEAMLAGLLHNVGKLYICMRACDQSEVLADRDMLAHMLGEWHGAIGRVIIESWGFSAEQAAAAEEHLDHSRSPTEPDLVDIVQASVVLYEAMQRSTRLYGVDPDTGEIVGSEEEEARQASQSLLARPVFLRLSIDQSRLGAVLSRARDDSIANGLA
ncbi:MAG: HDOD domain-containing protein [Pseudomonadota bacterium]